MIDIIDKKECCGCGACVQICPKSCIDFSEDNEGFYYPKVDLNLCINCHLCEKVCPEINPYEARDPLSIYGAKNKNEEIRTQSSSGGVFSILAEYTINKQGVVFGAKFDNNWEVIHAYAESVEELEPFRCSKYVQSYIGNSYIEAQQFLKNDRYVLFTGTPCQIAGLKHYLRKDYDKLITLDIICHGVPSRKIWRHYLKELFYAPSHEDNHTYADYCKSISFRDKKYGWKGFGLSIQGRLADFKDKLPIQKSLGFEALSTDGEFYFYENLRENPYLMGFLRNLFLRPSCGACPAKSLKSGSDMTVADFWGIKKILPKFADDKGVSLVIINTVKGQTLYRDLDLDSQITDFSALQPVLYESVEHHSQRSLFFEEFHQQGEKVIPILKKFTKHRLLKRIRISIKNFFMRFYRACLQK